MNSGLTDDDAPILRPALTIRPGEIAGHMLIELVAQPERVMIVNKFDGLAGVQSGELHENQPMPFGEGQWAEVEGSDGLRKGSQHGVSRKDR